MITNESLVVCLSSRIIKISTFTVPVATTLRIPQVHLRIKSQQNHKYHYKHQLNKNTRKYEMIVMCCIIMTIQICMLSIEICLTNFSSIQR